MAPAAASGNGDAGGHGTCCRRSGPVGGKSIARLRRFFLALSTIGAVFGQVGKAFDLTIEDVFKICF